ncbi:MAG: Adenylate cyclase [Parcubacteria group bacterium Licking1014_1]|nr:MAG: Adenylate cyclase [Parcubacteria group bacterium Licking1014_1]
MAKIEVEHRGLLTEKKFTELNKYLKKNGKFLGEKDRFSVIYFLNGEKENFDLDQSCLNDLRVRITNKKAKLVLKHGEWSGKDARKEFSFPIETKKFGEMIEFLDALGFYYGALQATKTFLYKYKGAEIALVKVPGWGYYFEVEVLTGFNLVDKANEKIANLCKEFGVKVINNEDFLKLCESLNMRPGFKFNFRKEKFSDIKKRFVDYF